jgi:hypothetical protein
LALPWSAGHALDKAEEHREAERQWREAIDLRIALIGIDSSQMATLAVFKRGRTRLLSSRLETP